MSNYVLGLGNDLWISSASLCKDGRIISAISEERLNRIKNFRGYPRLAIKKCLFEAGIELSQVNKIVVGWNPAKHMSATHGRYLNETRWRPEYLYNIPAQILSNKSISPEFLMMNINSHCSIEYIDHHLAHAAGSVLMSGFDKCFYYVLDGVGEIESSYYGFYENKKFTKLGAVKFPHSIGLVYSAITQFLGFKPHSDEWKVMALSAFSHRANNKYYKKLSNIIKIDVNGNYRIHGDYFSYHLPEEHSGSYTTSEFEKYIGLKRAETRECVEQSEYLDLAAAIQFVFEDKVFEIIRKFKKKYKFEKICLSGGCFMNSLFNGKLANEFGSNNIYIGPAPDDSGISLGASLYGSINSALLSTNNEQIKVANWGGRFDDQYVEKVLRLYKIKYAKMSAYDQVIEFAANKISSGALIGWFQGRSEFGQRALGNRSILADPRSESVKDRINSAVKFREGFRPFAPSIMKEFTSDYFDVDDNFESNFMEKVANFKKDKMAKVKGVVHNDGTGRVQTVAKEQNELYYSLLNKYYQLTGVPILLNTSFNVNGEPNVESPEDAIKTFFTCGLEILIINKFVVMK